MSSANPLDRSCLNASVGSQSQEKHLYRDTVAFVVVVAQKVEAYAEIYSNLTMWFYVGSVAHEKA